MVLKSGETRQMDSLHQMFSRAQAQKNMQKVERKCKSVHNVILQANKDSNRRMYVAMGF